MLPDDRRDVSPQSYTKNPDEVTQDHLLLEEFFHLTNSWNSFLTEWNVNKEKILTLQKERERLLAREKKARMESETYQKIATNLEVQLSKLDILNSTIDELKNAEFQLIVLLEERNSDLRRAKEGFEKELNKTALKIEEERTKWKELHLSNMLKGEREINDRINRLKVDGEKRLQSERAGYEQRITCLEAQLIQVKNQISQDSLQLKEVFFEERRNEQYRPRANYIQFGVDCQNVENSQCIQDSVKEDVYIGEVTGSRKINPDLMSNIQLFQKMTYTIEDGEKDETIYKCQKLETAKENRCPIKSQSIESKGTLYKPSINFCPRNDHQEFSADTPYSLPARISSREQSNIPCSSTHDGNTKRDDLSAMESISSQSEHQSMSDEILSTNLRQKSVDFFNSFNDKETSQRQDGIFETGFKLFHGSPTKNEGSERETLKMPMRYSLNNKSSPLYVATKFNSENINVQNKNSCNEVKNRPVDRTETTGSCDQVSGNRKRKFCISPLTNDEDHQENWNEPVSRFVFKAERNQLASKAMQ